jgi:hypothetical protein
MGVRRERPPIELAGGSIRLRLPDGSVKEMPVDEVRIAPVADDICCFCGDSVGPGDGERIRVTAVWTDLGDEGTQSWGAHRACLATRIHDSVSGAGPFFEV